LPWSASTATAQIVAALTMQRSAIFRTIPVVPENVVISRVGSDLARAAAPSRAGSSLRTAVVLSGSSSSNSEPDDERPRCRGRSS
jgi:acyl dehydratase